VLHIELHQLECGCFNAYHQCQLRDIAKLKGFTGNILPGTSIATSTGESASVWTLLEAPSVSMIEDYAEDNGEANVWVEIPANQQEVDDEAEADLAMEELIHGMASVMQASLD